MLYILIYSSVTHICNYQHQLPTQSIPAIQGILIYDKIPLEGSSEKTGTGKNKCYCMLQNDLVFIPFSK